MSIGQIMAECDCQHEGCRMRGYCVAETWRFAWNRLNARTLNALVRIGWSKDIALEKLRTYDGAQEIYQVENFSKRSLSELYSVLELPVPGWINGRHPKIGHVRPWIERWRDGSITAEEAMKNISGDCHE